MKMMKMKKNIMQRVALSVLIGSMSFSFATADGEAYISSLNIAGSFIYNIDKHFVDLINTSIKTPLSTCLIGIKKTIEELKQKGDSIKRSNDQINTMLHNLFEYVIVRFNVAYEILKKYNGKPDKFAELSAEMKREFNTEEIFSEILKRLRVIKGLAQQEGDTNLMKKLDTIIAMVEKKKKEWNGRSQFALLSGLTHRLQCK